MYGVPPPPFSSSLSFLPLLPSHASLSLALFLLLLFQPLLLPSTHSPLTLFFTHSLFSPILLLPPFIFNSITTSSFSSFSIPLPSLTTPFSTLPSENQVDGWVGVLNVERQHKSGVRTERESGVGNIWPATSPTTTNHH
ncbi:hypothetical protein Pcinc_034883 [Petrolisthes cinctipes]|uniref:Uncharacterized protein n=1 Tax=Petrolisthes cinctipes TaxID=88211 RepID=A0AAE1BXU6_PETCI|nr:hypothetical protein Pcinc_034883 [Petrolisthes cinctipes]